MDRTLRCGVRFAVGLAGVLLACACSSGPRPASGSSSDASTAAVDPPPEPHFDPDADIGLTCTDASAAFHAQVAPILARCSGSDICHGFPPPPRLYGRLVETPAVDGCEAGVLVEPGSLQRSYLLRKLTGIGMCPNTNQMPPGGAVAPPDIQTIADWICAGAPND